MYRLFRQLENDELMHVASRGEFEEAAELLELLNASFPGEYVIRDQTL